MESKDISSRGASPIPGPSRKQRHQNNQEIQNDTEKQVLADDKEKPEPEPSSDVQPVVADPRSITDHMEGDTSVTPDNISGDDDDDDDDTCLSANDQVDLCKILRDNESSDTVADPADEELVIFRREEEEEQMEECTLIESLHITGTTLPQTDVTSQNRQTLGHGSRPGFQIISAGVTDEGNLNVNIGNTTHTGGTSPEEGNKPLSRIQKLRKKTVDVMESWTRGMVKTVALENVLKKLGDGARWVNITGKPGEGKTTVAYMAIQELDNAGREIFWVGTPDDFEEVTMNRSQPVIMMDDVLGNLEFDEIKWRKWENTLDTELDLINHRRHEVQNKSKTTQATVLFVGREYVLRSVPKILTQDVVYVRHTSLQEKLSIWKAISGSANVHLDDDTIQALCQSSVPHGFPHVCRLFADQRTKNPKLNAVEFFTKPLEFLNVTVAKFARNKSKLGLFKEMIKGEGRVSVDELERLGIGFEIKKIVMDLADTYVKEKASISYLVIHLSMIVLHSPYAVL